MRDQYEQRGGISKLRHDTTRGRLDGEVLDCGMDVFDSAILILVCSSMTRSRVPPCITPRGKASMLPKLVLAKSVLVN